MASLRKKNLKQKKKKFYLNDKFFDIAKCLKICYNSNQQLSIDIVSENKRLPIGFGSATKMF